MYSYTLQAEYNYYPHFTDVEIEGKGLAQGSPAGKWQGCGPNPSLFNLRDTTLSQITLTLVWKARLRGCVLWQHGKHLGIILALL